MTSRTSWLLLILMVSLGLYAAILHPWTPPVQRASAALPGATYVPVPPPFTAAQFDAFTVAAREAEAVPDPLQRCLDYPNPPGLHWSDKVMSAYCHFKYDSWISRQDAERLIRTGHADELDKQLTAALQAQLASPGTPGALDHTLFHDFADTDQPARTRTIIDAWKRQRPQSAFAWAASGMAYLMADDPADDIGDRLELLSRARADLEHALRLDPRITHAYATMIDAGRIVGDRAFAFRAARRGLAVDPSNFTIYTKMALLAEPS